MTATDASPRRAQSLRGHTSVEAEDFPRHYLPTNLLIGEGFAVMSGCAHEVTFVWGSCVYPTRNFATLGILVTPPWPAAMAWPGHFCLTPHVAMRIGLSLRRSWTLIGAWRAVSEDPAVAVSC
jgi:hypothetical protein